MAQKNMHGPLMRFIRASDKQACEKARRGQGDFADVVVEEPTGSTPGKIISLSPGPRDPVGRLEAAISQVDSLDGFLAREDVQKRYYEALSLVYPANRFPRRSYEAILSQIREILPEAPGLRARLWEPRPANTTSFSMRAGLPIFGRYFDQKEFSKYLDSFLGDPADFKLDGTSPRALISPIVENTDEQIRQFELRLKSGAKSTKRKAFYAKLRSAPETQRALKLLLYFCLKGTAAAATFQGKNADEILYYFGQLKQNPSSVLGDCGVISFDSSFWISLIRSALPGLPELLRLHGVFPASTRRTRRGRTISRERFRAVKYEFSPVSRGLHKIWRGIAYNDCVGGNPDHLDQLMPERWACSLLGGTIFYDILCDEKIVGYCQLVPFEYGGNRYASIDTQLSSFFNQSEKGELLFVRWLGKIRELIPTDWKGLVVGGHPAGREPCETEVLRSLDCYKKGRTLGLPKDVHFSDELAAQIVKASEKRGYGAKFRPNYGSRMLTDASLIGEQSPLIVLEP